MSAVHSGLWRLRGGNFACSYPGGVTLRLKRRVFILRWAGYLPAELDGWRRRIGRYELHVRRVA